MLRPYQIKAKQEVYQAWGAGAKNTLLVMPTGAGKTVTFADIMLENNGPSFAIAHRSELITQMSLALARNNIRHRVIASIATQRDCTSLHLAELGSNFVDRNARTSAASVDTLIRCDSKDRAFIETTLWITDEGHHLTLDNKWGKAVSMFPNARGLAVTATPDRGDGKGLGRHADGLMDALVVGPSMRDLINQGYLTDYRVFAPPSDIDLSQVTVTASGDFSPPKLAAAVHKSHIVGDVVMHYLRFAYGKRGVTFAVDIESATEIAAAYRAAGVAAEVVSSKTPNALRIHIIRQFREGKILQLVNVDLFGEGFDLPAIEVVSLARPTMSRAVFIQQFGRVLRIMEGKQWGMVIDHVGNTMRHGLPDAPRTYTLDRREKRARTTPEDAIPLRVCTSCLSAYERVLMECPFCGDPYVPVSRSSPEHVEGDLAEMSPELLAKLRGEAVHELKIPLGATPAITGALTKHYYNRIDAQSRLRKLMALWGGWQDMFQREDPEKQRRFFHMFGIDVLSAQGLDRSETEKLAEKITAVLKQAGVDELGNNG